MNGEKEGSSSRTYEIAQTRAVSQSPPLSSLKRKLAETSGGNDAVSGDNGVGGKGGQRRAKTDGPFSSSVSPNSLKSRSELWCL